MEKAEWEKQICGFDERRDIIIPGNAQATICFCVKQFIQIGQDSIQANGAFVVALSGGSTPHAIFKTLSQPPYNDQLDWTKVLCFWSDERSVPPNNPENNFHAAMQAGLSKLPIPAENLMRMEAEADIEENAKKYEETFIAKVPSRQFDLMMLGMGEDGHIASLFPFTHGLHAKDKLIIANYVPQKQTWRLSVTYACIHASRHICLYVLGKNKADMAAKVLTSAYQPDLLPAQQLGVPSRKALWILDQEAASILLTTMNAC